LRIQSRPIDNIGQMSKGSVAIVRELHVYGSEVPLNQQNAKAVQHKGLGKALLAEAERIAREEFRAQTMTVLSGVGAREYYRELGYHSQSDYMVKTIESRS
ncbi:MAG: GNAT family N-acetyltransferase, partial [Chloroflexi bacterium]|nr:GNAT family N-acetyltransferase [Chloroflexota bacterium]